MFSGKGNPFYGKKHPSLSLQKQKATLEKRHGVQNAFALAKHRTKSKGQIELYTLLKQQFPEEIIALEKNVYNSNSKQYFVDIVFCDRKIIVEYNGDFWHCNPNKYNKNYWNPKKQQYAHEIWEQDKVRLKSLMNAGYKVFVIWESAFRFNKTKTIKHLVGEING